MPEVFLARPLLSEGDTGGRLEAFASRGAFAASFFPRLVAPVCAVRVPTACVAPAVVARSDAPAFRDAVDPLVVRVALEVVARSVAPRVFAGVDVLAVRVSLDGPVRFVARTFFAVSDA